MRQNGMRTRDRLLLLCDDTRETREVYETSFDRARSCATQQIPASQSRCSTAVITLDLQVEPIRGE